MLFARAGMDATANNGSNVGLRCELWLVLAIDDVVLLYEVTFDINPPPVMLFRCIMLFAGGDPYLKDCCCCLNPMYEENVSVHLVA